MSYIGEVVMDLEDAVTIIQALHKGEKYEYKYVSGGNSTHHVYPLEGLEGFEPTIVAMQDEVYRIAKLAGKPEK
jgi:hypothetical protein